MRKISFAVVGCGHIGIRHITEINAHPYAKLIAACDLKDRSKLDIEENNLPFFSSLDQLLSSKISPDVINICTPNGLHAEQTLKSLQHCNVVVEKPMALYVEDAHAMINMEAKTGHQLFCVMQNRYSPPVMWLTSLIKNKTLGKIYMVNLNCFWNRDSRYYDSADWRGTIELDGGTLFTQFSHFIDILFYLFSEIKIKNTILTNFNHHNITSFEDSGIISFELGDGGIGNMQFSTSVFQKNMESSITIIGEKGSVKVGGQYMDKVSYCNIQDYNINTLPSSNNINDYGSYKGSANNHNFVIKNVVNTLNGHESKDATPKESLKVIRFIQEVYSSRRVKTMV